MKLKGNLCALTYSWSPYHGILFHLPNELNVTSSQQPYSHCMVAGNRAFFDRRKEKNKMDDTLFWELATQ